MEEGRAGGWHVSLQGTTYGPYGWNDLVAWVREGRIGPDDIVWHPTLPGWVPARQVPGLIVPPGPPAQQVVPPPPGAPPAPGVPPPPAAPPPPGAPMQYAVPMQAQGRPSHRGRWTAIAIAAVVIIAGAVVGTLFAVGVFSAESPLVRAPMRDPTIIDVPYDSAQYVVPPEGGWIEVRGAQILVPAGAVESDTAIELRFLPDDFNMDWTASPGDPGTAMCVGPVVDFGPAGLRFDEAVTLTLTYDESQLPPGASEDTVAMAYWDGRSWAAMKSALDTDLNTVSVKRQHFSGEVWIPVHVDEAVYGKVLGSEPLALAVMPGQSMHPPVGTETTDTTGATDTTDTAVSPGGEVDITGAWAGNWTAGDSQAEVPIMITFSRDSSGQWTAVWADDPSNPIPVSYENGLINVQYRGMVFSGSVESENTIGGWATDPSRPDLDITWTLTRR